MSIKSILFATLTLVLFAPPSCPALAEDSLPVIKVGHVGHDHQIALYVAAEAGRSLEKDYGVYFEELKPQEVYDLYEGGRAVARVIMVRVGGGSKMPAALEEGHIEVGLGGLGPVAKFVDKGSRMKVLAPLNNDGDSLVLRTDFPAEDWDGFVKAVKESKRPVRIGYKSPMAVAFMILERALTEEGISHGPDQTGAEDGPVKVVMVNLQGLDQSLPSLENALVDGVVVNEPMGTILVRKGAGKMVADLSTLPPEGMWEGHPCCIVAATDDAIRDKADVIRALLKAIAAGGDLIARDTEKALDAEALWTRTPRETGRSSIRKVTYVTSPDERWLTGVDTWIDMMAEAGHFSKRLRGRSTDEVREAILDLGAMKKALAEMPPLKGGGR